MNDTKRKTSIFTLFFAVVLLLCLAGVLGALPAPEGTAYAETGQARTAAFTPTQFTTTFNSVDNTYTITGFDTNDAAWTGATAEQKKDIAIVIPATYNDGSNDEHPVVAIGSHAFNMNFSSEKYNGYVFTSLDLSGASNLTKIDAQAFYNCSGLTGDLTIPNSVTTIGNFAFYGCSGFNGTLTLPENANFNDIGQQAFYNCSGLTGALTIPNSVKTIGSSAFSGCSKLTGELTIPNSVTTIGAYAFKDCSGFDGTLTLPTNDAFTTIGEYAFSSSGLTGALTIPNSVTTIGASAFRNCSGLTGALTIPNSVTTIGASAFRNCSGLTGALTIPNSVTTIGNYAFQNCSGFNDTLTLPANDGFTTIGSSVFSGCSGLTGALTIPNSVTTIGNNAFYGCSGFNDKLTFPANDGFTTIGSSVFSGCSGLTGALTIPNSVTTIGNNAFYDCPGFTGALTIPNSVTSIEYSAFSGCKGFKTIHLPHNDSGTNYGTDVFLWITCPIVAPSKELYNIYREQGHKLSGYSSLTYELNVTFDANGGTISDGVQTKLFHYSIKMVKSADGVWAENSAYALPVASKTNYAFAGWNSQADGEGAYSAESLLTSSINTGTPLTYYAQYSEVLSGITVTGTPNKSQYTAFEAFDTTGLTVTANYASGASATITDYTVKYTGGNTSLRYGDTAVTISYTENGVEKTATVSGISVNKIKLTAPTIAGTYAYSGSEQTVTLSGYDGNTLTVSNNKRTNAGEQNVTVALKDTTNYEWSNGTTAPLSLKWTIATAKIAKPAENTSTFTYTGSAQTIDLRKTPLTALRATSKPTRALIPLRSR